MKIKEGYIFNKEEYVQEEYVQKKVKEKYIYNKEECVQKKIKEND